MPGASAPRPRSLNASRSCWHLWFCCQRPTIGATCSALASAWAGLGVRINAAVTDMLARPAARNLVILASLDVVDVVLVERVRVRARVVDRPNADNWD